MNIRWFEPTAGTSELVDYPDYRSLWFQEMQSAPVPTPSQIHVPPDVPSEPLPSLADLGLIADRKRIPKGGAGAARRCLEEFLTEKVDRYYWQLSYPIAEATTGLSPYIKFGVISVRECVHIAQDRELPNSKAELSRKQLIARLRWGSGFAQRFRYLPQLELRSLYSVFDEAGWDFDETLYQAWQEGQMGFPIVDAAARCLQATGGWKQLNFRTRALYSSFLSNLLGMDWRYGALHFMRHLIDGDCPIDHYQWAMQAGVTHCIDKTWTRIYNPEQVAVDRCDPDGLFIKQWVPEVAHLSPEQLGSPPKLRDYPSPILNYRIARQRRVKQLEQQRHKFLRQENILPYLARIPDELTPFGADRFQSDVGWAIAAQPELFPPPLDLDGLDIEQSKMLRSWFVAHVNIPPRKGNSRKTSSRSRQSKRQQPESPFIQLDLLNP
jgi:deoxyribodipyrimidine photo-lyase